MSSRTLHTWALVILGSVGLGLVPAGDESEQVEDGDGQGNEEETYLPISWFAIMANTKWIAEKASIQGYLGFEGQGDYPAIKLWNTKEALDDQRLFSSIRIETVSASVVINEQFGWGVDGWRVMEGLFVAVSGKFERQAEGQEDLAPGLGTLSEIQSIEIQNKGLPLLLLKLPQTK